MLPENEANDIGAEDVNDDPDAQSEDQTWPQLIQHGRVCNMIGEVEKKKNDYESAIKYYLRGLSQEPSFVDNYVDLAELCELLNEHAIGRIFFIFAKLIV